MSPPARRHLPLRPIWLCRACAAEWPCRTARVRLAIEYVADPVGLARYLGTALQRAVADLYRLNPDPGPDPRVMHARFLAWVRPRLLVAQARLRLDPDREPGRGPDAARILSVPPGSLRRDPDRRRQWMDDGTGRPDFEPAAQALRVLVRGVTDDQLTGRTPCAGWTVGDLLDHLAGLTVAFRMGAEKAPDPAPDGPGGPSVANLDPAWRTLLPARLDELVAAWREPAAWTGEAAVGGAVLPGQVMGVFALNELVVHGWDLARATGQPYDPDPNTVEAVHALVSQQASADGTPGLFGPSITPPAGATPLERVLGLTGRDPAWRP